MSLFCATNSLPFSISIISFTILNIPSPALKLIKWLPSYLLRPFQVAIHKNPLLSCKSSWYYWMASRLQCVFFLKGCLSKQKTWGWKSEQYSCQSPHHYKFTWNSSMFAGRHSMTLCEDLLRLNIICKPLQSEIWTLICPWIKWRSSFGVRIELYERMQVTRRCWFENIKVPAIELFFEDDHNLEECDHPANENS